VPSTIPGAPATTTPGVARTTQVLWGTLAVNAGPDAGRSYPLQSEPVDIGRDPGGDVVLTDSEVSRKHARITREDSNYYLEDLKSTNHTYLNGKLVSQKQKLKAGDEIKLGSATTLTFNPHPSSAATQVAATLITEKKTWGSLAVKGGPDVGKTFPLQSLSVDIGRDPSSDVVLTDSEVSRKHARITREDGNYYLEDLGSANHTYLNGKLVSKKQRLKVGDEIRLGSASTLTFEVSPEKGKK